MKLAPRVTLVGLVTLALPWAGCQYVREVEASLRSNQADLLAASTGAAAASLDATILGSGLEAGRFAAGRTSATDVYAHRLRVAPAIDGFVDDWSLPPDALNLLGDGGPAVSYVAGERSGTLYLFLQVTDGDVVYGGRDCSDRVRLALVDDAGRRNDLIFVPEAPGNLRAFTADGRVASRVGASWQATSSGYNLELAIPSGAASLRFGFVVTDARSDCRSVDVGTLPSLASEPGWLLTRSAAAEVELRRGAPPGTRIRLVDRSGHVLADAASDALATGGEASPWLARLIGMLVGSPDGLPPPPRQARGRVDIDALADVFDGRPVDRRFRRPGSGRIVLVAARPLAPPTPAVLVAELDTPPILSVTDRAARRLIVSSVAASAAAVSLLLGLAAWLSWRIRRLSRATRDAIDGQGEIVTSLPDTGSRDELGELSRDFSRLLGQVAGYNAYLKTLGQKLTHELRTPMTVVQTSLENLEADPGGDNARRYIRRAREGVERLQAMMTSLGAATRVEQAISGADYERFDIVGLVRDMGAAYAAACPALNVRTRVPDAPCEVSGSPELVAQMLDKLFENAADFCPPGGNIDVGLERAAGRCVLTVANTGSLLPESLEGRLFDSLVSERPDGGDDAHLGLGLHIARLIARHHGGRISASNLPGLDGVVFTVELPDGDRGPHG